MSEPQYVKTSAEEAVTTIVINHPPANVLSTPVMTELNAAIDALGQDNEVKAAIITGAGSFFVAGADVREIAGLPSAKEAEEAALLGQSVFNKIEALPIPMIAVVNGMCLGGGNEMILSCHIRMASERARFAQPEINLGIIPGFGGSQRLARLVGNSQALEVCLTGDMLSAKAALEIGLVGKVVADSDLLRQAQGLAKKIASKSRPAIVAIVQAIREGTKLALPEALALEAKLFGEISQTEDMKEGMRAFLEKRRPNFKDR